MSALSIIPMASIVDLVVARIRARILQYVVNNQEKELQWRLWLLYCLGNSQDLRTITYWVSRVFSPECFYIERKKAGNGCRMISAGIPYTVMMFQLSGFYYKV